jgi:hypothetical protein
MLGIFTPVTVTAGAFGAVVPGEVSFGGTGGGAGCEHDANISPRTTRKVRPP